MQIHIPSPCHEDWSQMAPDTNGRFCQSCAKTVVDFTAMSDEDVQNYLVRNREQNTCGRFRGNQVSVPPVTEQTIIISRQWFNTLPYARQLSYAILLCFTIGFTACDTNSNAHANTTGDTLTATGNSSANRNDTADRMIVGKIRCIDSNIKFVPPVPQVIEPNEPQIMGGIEAPPPPVTGAIVSMPDTVVPVPPAPPQPEVLMGEPAPVEMPPTAPKAPHQK